MKTVTLLPLCMHLGNITAMRVMKLFLLLSRGHFENNTQSHDIMKTLSSAI